MFGIFKKDPIKKLRKEHARLLNEAHRLSIIDRTKSDEMIALASQVEDEIINLTEKYQ